MCDDLERQQKYFKVFFSSLSFEDVNKFMVVSAKDSQQALNIFKERTILDNFHYSKIGDIIEVLDEE